MASSSARSAPEPGAFAGSLEDASIRNALNSLKKRNEELLEDQQKMNISHEGDLLIQSAKVEALQRQNDLLRKILGDRDREIRMLERRIEELEATESGDGLVREPPRVLTTQSRRLKARDQRLGGHMEERRKGCDKIVTLEEKMVLDQDLYDAAGAGSIGDIERLLSAGADVDSKHDGQYTPLHIASESGHLDAVQTLLAWGATVNGRVDFDYTALMLASGNGHLETVQALIDWGACIESRSRGKLTSLMLATMHNHPRVVSYLIRSGANVNAESKSGETALGVARRKGYSAIIDALEAAVLEATRREKPKRFFGLF